MILRALKASHGDSLLLLGDGSTVLIDGGPSGVYNNVLRDQLESLPAQPDGSPPLIDLLMISHIDADHIDGILDLTAEMIEADQEDGDPIVRLARCWHNSFSDTIPHDGAETPDTVQASAASVADLFGSFVGPNGASESSELVLASVAQGRQLRLDVEALKIPLNQDFDDDLVLQGNQHEPLTIGGLTLTVIGPTQAEVDDLRELWAKKLPKILKDGAAASPQSVGELDKSVSNLASIVAVAESGGELALLTGDARGDMMLPWLEAAGLLKGPNGSGEFHIVKLPHHGAAGNVSPEFFERVRADHYLVSGNGGHGNPEPNVLDMLFTARPELDYLVHMTYGPEELKTKGAFIKAGNVPRLDDVLSDPAREAVLRYPEPGAAHIDIGF